MSKEQLKALIAKFKDDQSITHKLKKAKTAKQVAGIAKQYSHEFTDEHVTQLSKKDLMAWQVVPLLTKKVLCVRR